MRVYAPFLKSLATGALLFACLLLPVSLLAKVPKSHGPKPPKAAHAGHHPKAVHPRSNVHKVGRYEKRVSVPETTRRRSHAVETAKADNSTTNRVHAWVKSVNGHTVAPAPNAGNHAVASPAAGRQQQGVSAPAAEMVESDEVKPISVISTIRNADTIGADKPQLPPVEDLAGTPIILPTLYNKRGRLIVPPALKGSHEILLHQNEMADSEGLERIHDDEDLDRMRSTGMLVPLPVNSTLRTDDRLPLNRRYCRPWTALFLDTLARQHYAHFQTPLQITSAVRTVEFQQRLIHTNGNAAPAEGDTASPHLTGQAIDIGKRGLSMAEIAWLRGYLLPLVQQGKVDVEEEFQQSCFHISVYKKYMPSAEANRRVIATTHREGNWFARDESAVKFFIAQPQLGALVILRPLETCCCGSAG